MNKQCHPNNLGKTARSTPQIKKCDPILPGITAETSTWPQPPTNLMNNEAKPGYDETKSAQHFHIFHQLGAPGNGPAGPEPDGSDVFFLFKT